MRTDQLPRRKRDLLPPADPSPTRPTPISIRRAADSWLQDGRSQGRSEKTLKDRGHFMGRVIWWLEHEARVPADLTSLAPTVVRQFLAYVRETNPSGRFGCERAPSKREARPSTVNDSYRMLRALVNWCREEGLLDHDPLKNVKAPRVPNVNSSRSPRSSARRF